MCIIVSKPSGKDLPSREILSTCFSRNKDGAGLMYESGGKIYIDKGYMNFKAFYDRVEELEADGFIGKDNNVAFHFRIATEGSVRQGTCHPFPISTSLSQLNKFKLSTDIAMVHNGIIPIQVETEDTSDTQEFIYKVLSKPATKKGLKARSADAHNVVKDEGGLSKFCILTPDEMVRLGGDWEIDEGIFYSNKSYKPYVWEARKSLPVKTCGNSIWDRENELYYYLDDLITEYWKEVMSNGLDHDEALSKLSRKHVDKLVVSYMGRRTYGYGC